jgi:hypothetical protein
LIAPWPPYYGQRFGGNALPKANDLDTVSKIDVANALDQATRRATPKWKIEFNNTRRVSKNKINTGTQLRTHIT